MLRTALFLLLLPALCLAQDGFIAGPPAHLGDLFSNAPHPVHPVDLGYMPGEDFDDPVNRPRLEEHWIWEALKPGWLVRDKAKLDRPLSAEAAVQFLDEIGSSMSWGVGTRARKVAALANRPVGVRYRLSRGDTVLLEGTEQLLPGSVQVISDVISQPFVMGFGSWISTAATMSAPEEGLLFEGTSLALELLPIPGWGWQTELALVSSRLGAMETLDAGHRAFVGKQRLNQHLREFGGTVALQPGEPRRLVVPSLVSGLSDVLEIEILGQAPEASLALGEELVCVIAPTLSPASGDGTSWNADYSNGAGYLGFEGPAAQGRAASAAATAMEQSNLVECELSVTRVTAEGDEQPLARISLQGIQGSALRFAQGNLLDALIRWEASTADGSRTPECTIDTFFSGLRGVLRLPKANDPASLTEVDLSFTKVDIGVGRTLNLAEAQGPGAASDHDGAFFAVPSLPAVSVRIEEPRVAQQRIHGVYAPDADGRIVIERRWQDSTIGTLRVELLVGKRGE